MRAASTLLLLVAGACTGARTTGASGDEHPVSGARTFALDDRLCVPESWTVELPPDQQGPVSEVVGACKNYVDEAGRKANPIACGPCGFVFDPVTTRKARERTARACCYAVSSPPPPELPTPDSDPRFACAKNGDCVASCTHGAVSRVWHVERYPHGESCEDGCTSKGTEPPMCVDGGCVGRRAGKDDPLCTRLDRAPIDGATPNPFAAPLVLDERNGFSRVEASGNHQAGRFRYSSPPGGGCMVDMHWWRPMSPDPGQPMAVASRRSVTVDGIEAQVVTTSVFEGRDRRVDVVFLNGDGYLIRIVFDQCGEREEDGFLAGIRIIG